MPQVKKRQRLYKQQFRTSDGRFESNRIQLLVQNELNNNEEADDNIFELEIPELDDADEWRNDDDSEWEDVVDMEKEKEAQSKFMMTELGKESNDFKIICFYLSYSRSL